LTIRNVIRPTVRIKYLTQHRIWVTDLATKYPSGVR